LLLASCCQSNIKALG
jgi:hypothetical protein